MSKEDFDRARSCADRGRGHVAVCGTGAAAGRDRTTQRGHRRWTGPVGGRRGRGGPIRAAFGRCRSAGADSPAPFLPGARKGGHRVRRRTGVHADADDARLGAHMSTSATWGAFAPACGGRCGPTLRRTRSTTARIGFISPSAEFTPKTVETRELCTDLVYRLRVVVDNPDGGLRQGMPVTVTLDFDEVE